MNESSPSPPTPSVDFLREAAGQQGVYPADDDLEGVLGFLEVVLPKLADIEERLPSETAA